MSCDDEDLEGNVELDSEEDISGVIVTSVFTRSRPAPTITPPTYVVIPDIDDTYHIDAIDPADVQDVAVLQTTVVAEKTEFLGPATTRDIIASTPPQTTAAEKSKFLGPATVGYAVNSAIDQPVLSAATNVCQSALGQRIALCDGTASAPLSLAQVEKGYEIVVAENEI
jgi:hypothetical protein